MSYKFILDEQGQPKPEPDLYAWGRWMQNAKRHVADDQIGEIRVSTVFLGLDHDYSGKGPPILWETMVFGGKLDQKKDRCAGSREQAEAMHAAMVARVRNAKTGQQPLQSH